MSVAPLLAVPGLRSAVASRPVIAVSPILGGQAVKGPAAKMYAELGIEPSALAVARHYGGLLNALAIDQQDADLAPAIEDLGITALVTPTLMLTAQDRRRLAKEIIEFAERLIPQ